MHEPIQLAAAMEAASAKLVLDEEDIVLPNFLSVPHDGNLDIGTAGMIKRPFRLHVDMTLIEQWRRDSVDTHGACCNDIYDSELSRYVETILLVDVRAGCLVELLCTTRFVTLSYVWGAVPAFTTTHDNVVNLRESGSLFASSRLRSGNAMPDTIRDAVHLVEVLGEQYLWLDRLCLVQDVPVTDMDQNLEAMAYIYANADFTIAATGGDDANYGLRGIG